MTDRPHGAPAIEQRLAKVAESIYRLSPEPDQVRVIGVTKRFDSSIVKAGIDAGLVDFGENYAQELISKATEISNASWHFIGALQRNKVKKISHLVDQWHTVDRLDLISELAKRCPGAQIFIQVNSTGEDTKSGAHVSEVPELVDAAKALGLDVQGLMTMGPSNGADPSASFELTAETNSNLGLSKLSMGMSNDFELALRMGATHIRVGTKLFGQRPG